MKVSLLGAGSWGTTLAVHLSNNGHEVTLWEINGDYVVQLNKEKENKIFLPGISLPDNLTVINDISLTVINSEVIVFAVPSHFMRETAKKINDHWSDAHNLKAIVSVSKGLELKTHKRISQILLEELTGASEDIFCALSGPSHAEEVSRGVPTALVAASISPTVTNLVQDLFFSSSLRVYAGDDVVGIELGGSLKNTIAIAAGIVDGAGFGDNTKAALMTRGLVEMSRMGVALGAKVETFQGLAGMGDMIVTCLSRHSRNRHLGEEIGKGKSLDEVLDEMTMVAEGVNTTKAIRKLSEELSIEMPISDQVYEVLFENKSPRSAVEDLMMRDPKSEKI
ncbi:MAG: NAD(P)H-dependent glycerol-3-phosphate dehydrogenase [Candidatus Marinimicrobia bacterium]|nr:NAD(P)H-dependent glycerol-3-phosphate dehydrogenase [Candidatus Neomarinimicrobiota bacterium]MCH7954254.1 NAD(P)H-dependent glycerol-3-phosphate dehydrogenase [Candidatus Neomarinimicrobiota bacterium]